MLHLDVPVSRLQEPVLHVDVPISKLQEPVLLLDLSSLQKHVLHLYRDLSCTYQDNESLHVCWSGHVFAIGA